MKNKEPKVAIVICVYNPKKELIEDCLDSLKKMTSFKNYKVIISDNNSINGVPEQIKKKYKWVDMIKNKENLYYAGGNNVAIKYALKKYNPDYFFILNDDMKFIKKGWLNEIIKTAQSDKEIGLVGINPVYPDGVSQNPGGYIKGYKITIDKGVKGTQEFDHITGVFLIKREVIDKIGLIDEIFIPYLLEETDYCLRAKKAGFKVVSRGDIKIIHYKGQTINKEAEVRRNFIRMKNDVIFSSINLKIHYAMIRILFYLPLVMLMKKKDEKKEVSIRNSKFRDNLWKNFLNIIKGYYFFFRNIKMILRKRRERRKNTKVWY